MGDVLRGVVDGHGEMVGGADVLAGKNDVAQKGGFDGDPAVAEIMEGKGADQLGGFSGIQPPAGITFERKIGDLVAGEVSAGAGIKGAFGTVGSAGQVREFLFDFAAGAEAGIDHTEVFEPGEGFVV